MKEALPVLEFISRSPEETRGLGVELGQRAQPGDIILLVGPLGAGKTCLTQGIAWGLGISGYATSPSFVLMNEYRGRLILYHIDLFRLDSKEEIAALGLEDYLYGSGVCVVEWANKDLEAFPEERLLIRLEPRRAQQQRRLRLEAQGARFQALLAQLPQKLVAVGGKP